MGWRFKVPRKWIRRVLNQGPSGLTSIVLPLDQAYRLMVWNLWRKTGDLRAQSVIKVSNGLNSETELQLLRNNNLICCPHKIEPTKARHPSPGKVTNKSNSLFSSEGGIRANASSISVKENIIVMHGTSDTCTTKLLRQSYLLTTINLTCSWIDTRDVYTILWHRQFYGIDWRNN